MQLETRLYGVSQFFLSAIGHWPYQNCAMKYLRRVFVYVVLGISAHDMISILIMYNYSVDIIIMLIPPETMITACIIKHTVCWMNNNAIKSLVDRIKEDRNALNEKELPLLEVQNENGRKYARVFAVILYLTVLMYLITPLVPLILDVIKPWNVSRMSLYYPEGLKIFYTKLVLNYVVTIVSTTVQVATSTFVIICSSHACGIFEVLGYKLQHIYDDFDEFANNSDLESNFHLKVKDVVQYHKKAIRYIGLIESYFGICYVVQLTNNVLVLCFISLRMCDLLNTTRSIHEVAMYSINLICNFSILYLIVYPAQRLSNSSEQNFYRLSSAYWYRASTTLQKTMLVMLQRCVKPCRITAAHLITMSFETFATIVQMAMSYFTVLYSLYSA